MFFDDGRFGTETHHCAGALDAGGGGLGDVVEVCAVAVGSLAIVVLGFFFSGEHFPLGGGVFLNIFMMGGVFLVVVFLAVVRVSLRDVRVGGELVEGCAISFAFLPIFFTAVIGAG